MKYIEVTKFHPFTFWYQQYFATLIEIMNVLK